MELPSPPSLVFTVRRSEPELVAPAKPTPNELKLLSDIDDQEGLRFQQPGIQFFKYDPSMQGKDPARVIRDALAKALVFYYPFAGRLRELAGRKLAVDCTGEGVMFVEADADVRLEDFGDVLLPPFPCLDELYVDFSTFGCVIDVPIMQIQVTRLKCGGFISAFFVSHPMCDGVGLIQLMTSVDEIARGASAPSVLPVWQRELFNARNPPRITCVHPEYDTKESTDDILVGETVHRSFFFREAEIAAIRRLVPPHLTRSSTFELLTAFLWRCRTSALEFGPEDEVKMISLCDARRKMGSLLPRGFYGNAIASPAAVALAGELVGRPLGYAVELMKEAKAKLTEEYMRSLADLLVLRGRPNLAREGTFLVSELGRLRFEGVGYGWGTDVYSGTALGAVGDYSFYVSHKNGDGELGIVVMLCLPLNAMDRFVKEIHTSLKAPKSKTMVSSSL